VQAVVEAAWIAASTGAIGVAGTALTAYLGFRNTRKTTEQTVAAGAASTRATLAAAREDRFLERRAAAYEAVLTVILWGTKSLPVL
jgi:hypothetical protein